MAANRYAEHIAARSIAVALEEQLQRSPGREVLIFLAEDGGAQPVTCAQLHADARAVAHSLRRQGVGPGDLIVLALDHGYPLAALFVGAMYAGAVPSIFPYYTPGTVAAVYQGRVQRLVRQARARAVITLPAFAPALSALLAETGCPVLEADPETNDAAPDDFAIHQAHPDDSAYIQFSSGATGLPRGVMISHRSVLSYLTMVASRTGFTSSAVTVGWLPFYHDMGLLKQLLEPLLLGIQGVILAPRHWLRDPVSLMRAIHRYRGTESWMPTFGFAHCTRRIRESDMVGLDLSSWRILGCGGEPIQYDVLQQFAERFAPYGLRSSALAAGYGMAENTLGVSRTAYDEEIAVKRISRSTLQTEMRARPVAEEDEDGIDVVSCGIPHRGTTVEIVDEHGGVLAERCVGEIRIQSPSLFAGYYRQPEATARALRDGWFYSGDLGFLMDGELYVVDRKKDLIISAGQNIYPHHLEEAVYAVAGRRIRRAVAFGVRDESLATELPVLVVELRGEEDEERAREQLRKEIRRYVRQEMEVSLADVRFVERGWIETTTSGKLARGANQQKYLEAGFRPPLAALGDLDIPDGVAVEVLEAALSRLVAAVTGRTEIDPQLHLADLGVDSLALLQVILLIEEKLGRSVPVEQLALRPTIHHLARLMHASEAPGPQPFLPPRQTPVYPLSRAGSQRLPLHRRLLRQGPALRNRALPYSLGTRLLRSLVRQPRIRQALYPRALELLDDLLKTIPVQSEAETVIQQSLMVNSWPAWRRLALMNQEAFTRWVTVKGAEVLHESALEKRGVVLAFPHTELRKLLRLLPALQGEELVTIGNVGAPALARQGMARLAGAVAGGAMLSRVAVRSAQLIQGLRVLGNGGVVVVASDDDEGEGGIHVPFHGRLRPLRPGAAELALRAGAAFVPAFAALDVTGHITFEFLEPLTPTGTNHDRRVNSLLHQYAELLADRYTTELGAMEWYILRKFLRYPVVK